MRSTANRALRLLAMGLVPFVLTACASSPHAPPADPRAGLTMQTPASSAEALAQTYHLGPGDHLRVTVYQQPDLSGEFEVDPSGQVALPLIELIPAQGKTVREFQQAMTNKLAAGYLVNPRINVEVLNYRPFYITGEVNKPGEYPYVAGMNLLKAIAMAGGYTYRANTSKVFLTHTNSTDEQVVEPKPETQVLPGDFIKIPERFF
jgi:protein involved in polysaccharide export with SLBB domain